MATKEKKTEAELKALIMDAIRQHPEFSNILNVIITRPSQGSANDPNWGFAWSVRDGPRASDQASGSNDGSPGGPKRSNHSGCKQRRLGGSRMPFAHRAAIAFEGRRALFIGDTPYIRRGGISRFSGFSEGRLGSLIFVLGVYCC
jgi:hypothetical protein